MTVFKMTGRSREAGAMVFTALAAGIVLYFAMALGAGVSTDSIVFLNVAENILESGRIYLTAYGENTPMTHFPPLYPLLLAGVGVVARCSPESSAKIAGAFCFAANLGLVTLFLRRCGFDLKTAIFAVSTLALSEYMILIHAKVFTEPLFIVFMLLALLSLARHLETGRQSSLLVSAGCVSLACLTRYAGLFLIPLGALSILFFTRSVENWRRRLGAAFAFGFGLFGHCPFHLLWQIDMFYFYHRNLNSPGIGMAVDYFLQAGVNFVPSHQQLVQFYLTDHTT
jgi:4-amino-4-deoxy-L-arabinose transferase-like glycosyltransferase